MPIEAEFLRENDIGVPIAITVFPMLREFSCANFTGFSPVLLIVITARSEASSIALSFASYALPSANTTIIFSMFFTTCAFVIISPFAFKIAPVPCINCFSE